MQYHPVNLISSAINEDMLLPEKQEQQICAITGEKALCVPRKSLFGKSFTNIDLLARPESNWVSVDAWRALKYKWQRMGSWICDGESFTRLDRFGVRRWAFREQMPEIWSAYVTTSYKKHGALRAKVNSGGQRVWLFEMVLVDLTPMDRTLHTWMRLNQYLRAGIGRASLESGKASPYIIKKIGPDIWMDFENWSRNIIGSPLYRFLCYLLPSQKELRDEV